MEARGHRFHVDAQSQDMAVMGDADRLAQVFSNLLANSSKYSPNGGEILLRAVRDSDDVVVSVTDKGIGIPANQLERVFDMFSQVRLHQGRSEGGLGIGLSLVRTIVQMHDGSVSVASDGPGMGSTFTVRLPLLKQHIEKRQIEGTPVMTEGAPLRIVIADDNIDSAQSLCLLLQADGHEVKLAADGRGAVDEVLRFDPAIVFMDVGMPGMDGIEATRLIRETPTGARTVIVALTGWGQPKDRERTRLAGADRHIVKPLGRDDLLEVLHLARKRLERPQ
jgi:CheY-like chemotaxis protein/anti-sigma regulatory factor (Ser/Thr protein kinase)